MDYVSSENKFEKDLRTYSYNIEETNDDSKAARGNQQPPERKTEGLLACSFLVHVPEHVQTEHHHCATQ